MRLSTTVFAIALSTLLVGCAQLPLAGVATEAVLPLQQAWVDGKKVQYITTDISDAKMALAVGVNYVPRLSNAVLHTGRHSLLERVYKFPKGEQITIFQSAPTPVGGENADRDYSPLWRLVMVYWLKPERVRELKSEAEVLAAEDAGELSLEATHIVANCPVVRGDGRSLAGMR